MNQTQLLQLFTQPVSEGLSIQELDQLLEFIVQAFSNIVKSTAVDDYMEQNFSLKLIMIMKTLYHFDSIKQLNPTRYNNGKFKQLAIFVQLYLKKLQCVTQESDQQQIFSLIVHLGIKYNKEHPKLISPLIGYVFEAFQEKTEYFDFLLQQMTQSLQNTQQQTQILPILFILDQLLKFLFNIRTLDQPLTVIVELIFSQLQFIDYSSLDENIGLNLSSIIVLCIQKYNYYKQDKLLILSQDQYLLQFMNQFILKNDIITSNIVKSLSLLIQHQQSISTQLKFESTQIPILGQLTIKVLPALIENVVKEAFDYSTQLTVLSFVCDCITYQFSYSFFSQNQESILFKLIMEKLLLSEEEKNNFRENASDFYEFIQSILKDNKDTVKGIIATILKQMSQHIDGFVKNFYNICKELLLYNFEIIQETPICNSLSSDTTQCNFFQCDPQERYNAIMLSYCIIYQQLVSRKDLRLDIEYFLKQYLKFMKKRVDNIGKCLGIEFIKIVLPNIYQHSEKSFRKCVKFSFQILNQQKQKKSIKLFAIRSLIELLNNDEVTLKMEEAIAQFHTEFCYQLQICELDVYYDFVLTVVQKCNILIDTYLDDIMNSLQKRIEFGCKKISINQAQYVNHTSIVFSCLKVLDTILSQAYCLKYTAQLEPTLIQITNYLLQSENLQFIDELFDACARYIAYTKGLTELIYIIFNNLPSLMEKNNNLTIESVFRLFLLSTIHASEVVKSKPEWISVMLKFIYQELGKNNSNSDNIRISVLVHQFYQYYNLDECCLILTEQFVKLVQKQLEKKEVLPKIYISIFMPVIMDNNKLANPQLRQLIINASGYLNLTFGKALTVYNYKYYFAIVHLLIVNSHLLFDDQHRQSILEQLLNNFFNKQAAYLDKLTFHSKMGNTNITQQVEKSIPTFDLEYQDNQLEMHLKEMTNYKLENQIEKPYIQDLEQTLIMKQSQQQQIIHQILLYIQINHPQIQAQFTQADKLLLSQIKQITEIDNDVRQIMNLGMLKRKKQPLKQYNVM